MGFFFLFSGLVGALKEKMLLCTICCCCVFFLLLRVSFAPQFSFKYLERRPHSFTHITWASYFLRVSNWLCKHNISRTIWRETHGAEKVDSDAILGCWTGIVFLHSRKDNRLWEFFFSFRRWYLFHFTQRKRGRNNYAATSFDCWGPRRCYQRLSFGLNWDERDVIFSSKATAVGVIKLCGGLDDQPIWTMSSWRVSLLMDRNFNTFFRQLHQIIKTKRNVCSFFLKIYLFFFLFLVGSIINSR